MTLLLSVFLLGSGKEVNRPGLGNCSGDYVLFVDRRPCGVIEAKADNKAENITTVEDQTDRYAHSSLKCRKDDKPLRALFEATVQIIRFTDGADPAPRSRELFDFYRPGNWPTGWRSRTRCAGVCATACRRCLQRICVCVRSTRCGPEQSLAENRPRALIHMATGAGKTFTAITAAYRLLKFGGAKRILFLVDTRNLGKQAHQEFMAYTPPDDPRKFTELYNVQRLLSSATDPHAQVCIGTIQRRYAILSGETVDDSAEDVSLNEFRQMGKQSKQVRYRMHHPN